MLTNDFFLIFHKLLNNKNTYLSHYQKVIELLDNSIFGFFHYLCTIIVCFWPWKTQKIGLVFGGIFVLSHRFLW